MPHITLFNQENQPLVERLVFIERSITATSDLDKKTYKSREKVTVNIKLSDSDGDPFTGVMSASILDLDQVIEALPEQTIYSELLLSSDLKGYIDNPMYYFNSDDLEVKAHLDLVMMTHGWSRFSWQEIFSNDFPELKFPLEQGFNLTGKLFKKFGKKEEANGKVILMNGSSFSGLLLEAESDEEGRFSFENLMLNKSDNILLKGKTEDGKGDVRFEIDSFPKNEAPKTTFKTFFGVEEVKGKDKYLGKKRCATKLIEHLTQTLCLPT